MLAGSTISGMVVSITAVLRKLQENRDKIETYLAFGASRVEVCIPIEQEALRIALMPSVNGMRCVITTGERGALSQAVSFPAVSLASFPFLV
jgi:ABC-type iron transport system FetAB permease component